MDENDTSENTKAVREINDLVVKDPRACVIMLQIGDGTTIIRKK